MDSANTDGLVDEKQSIERSSSLHWFHWLVVVSSLVLTYAAWFVSKSNIDEKVALQFDRQASQVVELVSERVRKYEDALWGGVAAIQSNGGDISYNSWLSFANSLRIDEKYPGISGIGVIHYVTPESMQNYLTEQRRERPDYALHPQHQKNEFWPITYIEPFKTNAKAVGLDMAHETNRYTAAVKARDTGLAQFTGPITLVQDSGKTPGFLFYAPFYQNGVYSNQAQRKANFTGLVYAPFVVKKLMEGTLHKEKRQVGIKIVDNNDVIYDEHEASNPDFDPNALLKKAYEVDLHGRTWLFDIRSTLSFREAAANNQPLVILIGGIIIDAMLLTLFILLAHSNKRAMVYINKVSAKGS